VPEPDLPLRPAVDLSRILDAVDQAIIVTDPAGTILRWSRGASQLYGWSEEEVVGRSILEVTPAEHAADAAADVMETLRAGATWSGEMVLRKRSGDTFLARVTDTPVLDDDGEALSIIGISEDVTDARWAEQALRDNEQRLRLALDAGALGVWEWDRRTGRVEWDDTLTALFGVAADDVPSTFEGYAELLHPDDRDAVLERIRAALEAGEDFSVEHRVIWPDGSVRWIEGHGRPVWDGDGVTGLVGVSTDITARHEAEAERLRLLDDERQARVEAEAARARLAFLAAASEVLNETLDLEERLRRLARLGVPRVADGCVIHLLDGDALHLVALHHVDPLKERVLHDLLHRYPPRVDAPVGIGAAIRDGRPSWLPEVTDDVLRDAAVDDRHLAMLRDLSLTASVVVPLVGRAGPIGALTFISTGGRRIDDDHVRLAEDLCARAGTSIENAQLLHAREEMEAASRFQAALLGTLYDSSVDGMLVVDPDGRVLSYNQQFLDLWGFGEDLVAQGDAVLLDNAATRVADAATFRSGVEEAYRARPARLHDEVGLADGRILDRYGAALRADDDEYLGFAWTFRDVTRERLQQAEIAAAGERFAAVARTLQQSLLPPRLPTLPGVELAARYHPALDGLEVGGDFYDVFAVGDDWMLVTGDVCGKGAEAAALTALIRYTIRAVAIQDPDPAVVLTELNNVMLHDADTGRGGNLGGDIRFATVCCIRLRPAGQGMFADVACGGHPLPLVVRATGEVEPAGVPGTIVGVVEDVEIGTTTVTLRRGDAIVAYTDGVIEARDADGTTFDGDRLAAVLASAAGAGADAISERMESGALRWQGGVAHDDIAVLAAAITR
jgi:sigma-B regulation protein RsbU (phosphoserine phosphatase)